MKLEVIRGRPKEKWLDATESNIRIAGVSVDDVGDRVKCRFRTWMADPRQLGESRERRKNMYLSLRGYS